MVLHCLSGILVLYMMNDQDENIEAGHCQLNSYRLLSSLLYSSRWKSQRYPVLRTPSGGRSSQRRSKSRAPRYPAVRRVFPVQLFCNPQSWSHLKVPGSLEGVDVTQKFCLTPLRRPSNPLCHGCSVPSCLPGSLHVVPAIGLLGPSLLALFSRALPTLDKKRSEHMASPAATPPGGEKQATVSPQERFFRYFQHEITGTDDHVLFI